MLYIEDYLELIEPFPQELRERLTEMREADLKIQNEVDKLEGRVDTFFGQCKRQKSEWKSENFDEIRKEYLKLLESADDKIQIANQLFDLIEKYKKKLDQELQKFKLELEADHAGITSKLEQVISSKANFQPNSTTFNNNVLSSHSTLTGLNFNLNQLNDESDFTLCTPNFSNSNDLMFMMVNSSSHIGLSTDTSQNIQSSINKRKLHSNQPNSSTTLSVQNDEDSSSSWQSAVYQARKNSGTSLSRKSNFLSNNNKNGHHSNSSVSSSSSNSQFLLNFQPNPKRFRSETKSGRKVSAVGNSIDEYTYNYENDPEHELDQENPENDDENIFQQNEFEDNPDSNVDEDEHASDRNYEDNENDDNDDDEEITFYRRSRALNNILDEEDSNQDASSSTLALLDPDNNQHSSIIKRRQRLKDDWKDSEDTNEKYCICKDVSYGEMIMCDNPKCSTQWFHFVCVGLSSAPKGKWFCPICTEIKKKRRERQMNLLNNTNNLSNPQTSVFHSNANNPVTSQSSSSNIT